MSHIVRRAGALALVWVLVAVASWAIASGGGGKKSSHAQPNTTVTASQASLQLPALNARLPAMRVKHRQSHHAPKHRSSHSGSGRTTQVDVQVPDTTTTSRSPVSSTGSSSSGASSSSAGSTSSGNVPPTGGAPPP